VTEHLFDVLERQSLFAASEYLALKVLNETSCTLDNDLAKQLETYRAMKKGNTAPNIKFKAEQTIFPDQNYQSLDDIPLPYTLVVFGASWCPKCQEEIPELANYYKSWQEEGVELVLVSLDENQAEYKAFVKGFPFISTCDYQKWNGQIVNDYYVFSTPTMYLLNSEREIVLRPNSIKQMEAWVDWYLVKENQ
ncbi:MAG: TlpA disulfide reductase family protein, partial [Nonlabens sp.]